MQRMPPCRKLTDNGLVSDCLSAKKLLIHQTIREFDRYQVNTIHFRLSQISTCF